MKTILVFGKHRFLFENYLRFIPGAKYNRIAAKATVGNDTQYVFVSTYTERAYGYNRDTTQVILLNGISLPKELIGRYRDENIFSVDVSG